MNQPVTINPADVIAVMQQRFPREYEIALQQSYIAILEKQVVQNAEKSDGGADA